MDGERACSLVRTLQHDVNEPRLSPHMYYEQCLQVPKHHVQHSSGYSMQCTSVQISGHPSTAVKKKKNVMPAGTESTFRLAVLSPPSRHFMSCVHTYSPHSNPAFLHFPLGR